MKTNSYLYASVNLTKGGMLTQVGVSGPEGLSLALRQPLTSFSNMPTQKLHIS